MVAAVGDDQTPVVGDLTAQIAHGLHGALCACGSLDGHDDQVRPDDAQPIRADFERAASDVVAPLLAERDRQIFQQWRGMAKAHEAEVQRLRAELAEARVQRDWLLAEADDEVRARYLSGARHVPVSSAELAGLAARGAAPLTSDHAVEVIKERYSDAIDTLADNAPDGASPQVNTLAKPRRDERINPAGA